MKQQGLFGQPPKYQAHSDTSKAAAAEIETNARTLRATVYSFLKISGLYGATDEELQVALNMNPSTERPRRIELVELRLVKDGGKKRNTKSGRKAVVWLAIKNPAGGKR